MSLQNALLGVLTYSPMNGYHLGKIFNKSINYSWTASLSQIYRELGLLEKKGFVTATIQHQADKPDKKIYSITTDGEKQFKQWLSDFPESFETPKRDEFLLRMFFGSEIGDAELVVQLKRFIKEREQFAIDMAKRKEKLSEMSKIMKNIIDETVIESNQRYWRFIVKRALMTNDTLIEWAKECIEELES